MSEFDVLILGGGIAGLAVALHLSRRGSFRIAVVDRNPLPGDPSALKLGESISESASWYLSQRCGLDETLRRDQLGKFGLRFFLDAQRGSDLGARVEIGPRRGQRFREGRPIETYQLHRGRLEHEMAKQAADAGVELLGGHEVVDIRPGSPHRIELEDGTRLRARWVIDATGSRQGIATTFNERHTLPHETHVAYGWLDGPVRPDTWSRDPAYAALGDDELRSRSTMHLVGPGYFVWVIRLPNEQTSVGVVTTDAHRLQGAEGAESLLSWLREHEPALAHEAEGLGWAVPPRLASIEAHAARKIVSPDRLGATGQAAVYLNPLYSSGLDLMAIANECIVASIVEDLAGENFQRHCAARNGAFEVMVANLLPVYDTALPQMADPAVGRVKVLWDMSVYAGFVAPLVTSGEFARTRPLHDLRDIAARVDLVNRSVQRLLTQWLSRRDVERPHPSFIDLGNESPFRACNERLRPVESPQELRELLQANLVDLQRQAIVSLLCARSEFPDSQRPQAVDPGDLRFEPEPTGHRHPPVSRRALAIDELTRKGVRMLAFD